MCSPGTLTLTWSRTLARIPEKIAVVRASSARRGDFFRSFFAVILHFCLGPPRLSRAGPLSRVVGVQASYTLKSAIRVRRWILISRPGGA